MADDETLSYETIRQHSAPRIKVLLEAFDFDHLPPELGLISKPFCDLAHLHAASMLSQPGPAVYLEIGLARLCEAKDALVRAALAL